MIDRFKKEKLNKMQVGIFRAFVKRMQRAQTELHGHGSVLSNHNWLPKNCSVINFQFWKYCAFYFVNHVAFCSAGVCSIHLTYKANIMVPQHNFIKENKRWWNKTCKSYLAKMLEARNNLKMQENRVISSRPSVARMTKLCANTR